MTQAVEVGFFSFTEVPDGAHGAYNEWHQLDHLPEQYAIDGIAHGERWVATPDCEPHRVATDPVLGRAQYLTLYLMTDPVEATKAAFQNLAVDLRARGRFFEQRESHLAGAWTVQAKAAAKRVLVAPEVIPWRPNRGIYAVVEPADTRPLDLEEVVAIDGVAGAWTFNTFGSTRITIAWLDADPVATAKALAPLLHGRTPVLAGPYRRVDPWTWDWFET